MRVRTADIRSRTVQMRRCGCASKVNPSWSGADISRSLALAAVPTPGSLRPGLGCLQPRLRPPDAEVRRWPEFLEQRVRQGTVTGLDRHRCHTIAFQVRGA